MSLVEDLERTAKDPNPYKFKHSFNKMKNFIINNWSQVDYDIDNGSRKRIAVIFETESSVDYRVYEYINLNLEYFIRFYYMWGFLFYFIDKISELYQFEWLSIANMVVFFLGIVIYLYMNFKWKKDENGWTNKRTFEFYTWLECFIPRKEKAYLQRLKAQGEQWAKQTKGQ